MSRDMQTGVLQKEEFFLEIMESEQHMWLECEKPWRGKQQGSFGRKTISRTWPNISTGLIKGIAALSFEDDLSKDSERLRVLISMTIWAIWKSRNKNSILDQDVAPSKTREVLKELIGDLIRKSWNATRFMEGRRRSTRQRAIKTLWADGRVADSTLRPVRPSISHKGMWPGITGGCV